MKKKVFLAVALIALMTGVLSAQTYDSESDFQVTKTATAVTITGYKGSKTVVNIPPRIQNLPVTIIGQSAFMDCTKLTSVTIPNGVTNIGSGAFYNTGLTSVTIPNSVTTIGQDAFDNCTNLISVTFQGPVSRFSSANPFPGDLHSAFYRGNPSGTLGTYTRPRGSTTWTIATTTPAGTAQYDSESDFAVTKAGNAIAISGYIGKKTVVNIPPTIQNLPVTIIGDSAFRGNAALVSVTIPNSVISIGNNAFDSCISLTSVTFSGAIPSTTFYPTAPFIGDLRTKFYATNATNGTPGTYTKPDGKNPIWTKK